MNPAKSFTATKRMLAASARAALLASACLAVCLPGAAWAARQAGTVVNLNGPLLAKKGDGTVKVLSLKSTVEEGDTLVTETATYARIRFVDNSEITLRPGSQLKIDAFVFEEAKPEQDSAAFNLVKGGLRAVTGALGKRNNERFGMNTPTATIGIRGTTFIAEYVPAPSGSVLAPAGKLPPGLYVQVVDGMINVSNNAGALNFSAGQFGYTPSQVQPPVIVPANPGMQFAPPPEFSMSNGPQNSGTQGGTDNGVDCEVR